MTVEIGKFILSLLVGAVLGFAITLALWNFILRRHLEQELERLADWWLDHHGIF